MRLANSNSIELLPNDNDYTVRISSEGRNPKEVKLKLTESTYLGRIEL